MIVKRLGQYEIVEEIGRGGMGTVYRARQVSLRGADRARALALQWPSTRSRCHNMGLNRRSAEGNKGETAMRSYSVRISVTIMACLFVYPWVCSSADALGDLQQQFNAAMNRIGADLVEATAKADATYARTLDRLLASAKASRDVDAITAIQREQTNVASKGSLPVKPAPGQLPSLMKARQEHHALLSRAQVQMDRRTIDLIKAYTVRLDALIKNSIRQNEVTKSQEAKAEKDKVALILVAAQSRLPNKPPAERAAVLRPHLPSGCEKGLFVHYTFDYTPDAGGERIADAGPGRRYGKAVRTEPVKEGKVGGALRFVAGNDSYVVIPKPQDVDLGKDFTVATWVKTSSDGGILGKGSLGEWNQFDKALYILNGKPAFVGHTCGFIAGNAVVTDGKWHHVAVTYGWERRNTGPKNVYVDGKRATSFANIITQPDPTSGVELRIGWGNSLDGKNLPFVGLLDEFMIFNRCLSDSQVGILFETLGGG